MPCWRVRALAHALWEVTSNMTTIDILAAAKKAAPSLSAVDSELKNKALLAMADALEAESQNIEGPSHIRRESSENRHSGDYPAIFYRPVLQSYQKETDACLSGTQHQVANTPHELEQ